MTTLRTLLLGHPLPTQKLQEERISRARALAALSPDALASVAYANQEIFLGLAAAGAAGLVFSTPIALAIAVLLAIVTISYMQIISAYPAGGGSYAVARANLGLSVSLVAASGLMIAYVLNVAVSVTAAVAAAASAFPALWSYRTVFALVLLAMITLANLRGVREAGAAMTGPVYFFLATYLLMIAAGVVRAISEGPGSFDTSAATALEPVTPFLILHTFAAGCTALTGVEAISNGVPMFKAPEVRHANQTMAAMALLMGVLFLGTVGLTQFFGVVAGPEETILSALARHLFGSGVAYLLVQVATLLVLTVAANTSFMGFPRVASIIARDGYLPRQLALLGERLVYSNGILLLSVLAGLLVVVFGGDTHALIPLFAIGTFLAFTLSQAGMVVRWWRERGPGWVVKATSNGVGMLVTGAALLITGVSRFLDGAWITVVLIPVLVFVFYQIHQHYTAISAQLTLRGVSPPLSPLPEPRVVLPIAGVHRGVIEAIRYARSISHRVTAVYVEIEPGQGENVRRTWEAWGLDQDATLVVVPSPYRSIVGPFLDYLDQTDQEQDDGQLATVILPEFIPRHWWETLLHNQTAWLLKLALLYRRRRYGRTRGIIDVPFYLKR